MRERTMPTDKAPERRPEKRPYAAPKLAVHGDVEEITRFISGAVTDGYAGSNATDAG